MVARLVPADRPLLQLALRRLPRPVLRGVPHGEHAPHPGKRARRLRARARAARGRRASRGRPRGRGRAGRVRLEDEPLADGHRAGRLRDALRPRRHDRDAAGTGRRHPHSLSKQNLPTASGLPPPPAGRARASRPPCTRGRSDRSRSRTARTESSGARGRGGRAARPAAGRPTAASRRGPSARRRRPTACPDALARCARPESFPTKRRADARTPSASGSVVRPLRSKTRALFASEAASPLTAFSPPLPRRTTERPRAESPSKTSAYRARSQRLAACAKDATCAATYGPVAPTSWRRARAASRTASGASQETSGAVGIAAPAARARRRCFQTWCSPAARSRRSARVRSGPRPSPR